MADLNLNNTGLSEDIIYELLTQAKESKNLVAIHLSNNPGVSRLELKDKKIKDYAKTRFMKALGIIKHFVSCDEYPNILEEESTGQSNEILTSNHKEFV
jgi:alanine racemase